MGNKFLVKSGLLQVNTKVQRWPCTETMSLRQKSNAVTLSSTNQVGLQLDLTVTTLGLAFTNLICTDDESPITTLRVKTLYMVQAQRVGAHEGSDDNG